MIQLLLTTIIATVVAESPVMSEEAAENRNQPVDDGGGGRQGEGGGTEMQVDVPSNDQQKMTYTYQPRTINNNNISELEEEHKRMLNHLKVHKKGLEDMDDDFITSFQGVKKSMSAAKTKLAEHLVALKEFGFTEEAYSTVTQVLNSPTTEPEKIQGQQRFVNFAYANMNQRIDAEKKLNVLLGEKRKSDDELALLKKNAADFEANKKSKPNTNYNAHQTYETISPKPNRSPSATNTNNNNNNNNNGAYDQTLLSSSSKTSYEFPNAAFNEKFTQKEVVRVTQDINTVYLSSPSKGLFDLARISHNNAKRNV